MERRLMLLTALCAALPVAASTVRSELSVRLMVGMFLALAAFIVLSPFKKALQLSGNRQISTAPRA